MRQHAREIEFNVDAYTARLIGRENVSKLEGAIFELVKNAYDADASMCCLYYSGEADCLYILDNGCGMEESTLITHWMTIGNSSKKEEFISSNGRVQTGAKGIGRFALDRLSDYCDMLTISSNGGLEWTVNWSDFDGHKKISDVKARLYDTDQHLAEFVNFFSWKNKEVSQEIINHNDITGTGTAFCLTNLHDLWDAGTMKKIRNHLENLLPPDMTDNFHIWFFDDETSVDDALISSDNVDSYDYRIEFDVDHDDLIVRILRNESDFRGEEMEVFSECGFDEKQQAYFHGKEIVQPNEISKILGESNCIGHFHGILYFYKITQTKKDQEKFYYRDITGRTNLVKQFGGIKIFRDQFRVRPYGEYGDNAFDWLELSARKNRSPAAVSHPTGKWRVASEQMLGSVFISRENHNLEDDANRNAIQEGIGLSQLKNILIYVISEFERDRQLVGRKLAQYDKDKNELQFRIEEMRRLAEYRKWWEQKQNEKAESDSGVEYAEHESQINSTGMPVVDPNEAVAILEDLEQSHEQQIQDLRDENKMLRTLATTGIVTNKFMHEIRTSTNNIGLELDSAYEALTFDRDIEYALKNVLSAIRIKKNFASWFGITIDSIRKDKRRRKKHNISSMLSGYMDTWRNILERSETELVYHCETSINFYCFEFDIENIISNLIANSLASFEREMDKKLEKREVCLYIFKNETGFLIEYNDSGWGLIPKYKERPELILEPFESGHTIVSDDDEDDGTGMGMWIVNTTINEYNGYIDLSENKIKESGFCAKIQMGGNDV